MGIIITIGLGIICLAILLAMIAASLYLADYLDRRTKTEMELTPEQRAMLKAITEGQPE